MQLHDLENFQEITIQCHDNPDADALASGYGLYLYFQSKGIETKLIYSGPNRIQKANLKLMVDHLQIPVEYWPPMQSMYHRLEGLLITVDCQYGAGNVTRIEADAVAIIDHHQEEIKDVALSRIQPGLGSCATLVWSMLEEEGFEITNIKLGTALYYGLYTDTNQFSEIYNPVDMDMRDSVIYNKALITRFRNSNLSLKELEIAGIALIRYSYNDDYRFGVIHAQPCDPNILGLISDFLLQVDEIDTCLVYNQVQDGYKFSVRSCIKEVNANELAAYLADDIGSGGGHIDKAGGFISMKLYEDNYPTMHSEGYFNNRMTSYFDSHKIIYATEQIMDISDMKRFSKVQSPEGCVKLDSLFPLGTSLIIRTVKGDIELDVEENMYVTIGHKGEISVLPGEQFNRFYVCTQEPYCHEDCSHKMEYVPTLRNRTDGKTLVIADQAKVCLPAGETKVYAKPLEEEVKVFTKWDEDHYILGKIGDYLIVREDDMHDISVVKREFFKDAYIPCN
ncbi:MAG: DHH family phosphoesterase [Lachnospiraceae bacterium]|nr:DHH family phosphoesterase [Lachnospiraceae bacterium]